MDGVALLEEARVAGLRARAEGDRLLIRGPRSAEPVAQRLLAHKAEVMAALALLQVTLPASASTASCEARPDPSELHRVLGLPVAQLDRVLRVAAPWLDIPLWFVPGEADAEALVAAGEARRGAVWTRRELLDLLSVPGLTPADARTVTGAKLTFDGRGGRDPREGGAPMIAPAIEPLPAITPWAWLPPRRWTCPRCCVVSSTTAAGPRYPVCHFVEGS